MDSKNLPGIGHNGYAASAVHIGKGLKVNKKDIVKYIVQDWQTEAGLTVTKCPPGQEVLWLQNNLNVPSSGWTKIPENINILPIPEVLYHPDDFSWAGPPRDGELDIPPPGIVMDDENKIIFVIVSDYKDVLAYYMFTYEILPVKGL